MSIRTIIFDLDGTLRISKPRWEEIFIREAKALGVRPKPEDEIQVQRWAHFFWADSDALRRMLRTHGESPAFWIAYNEARLQRLGCDETCARDLAPTLYERLKNLQETVQDIVPDDVVPTLTALRSRGYRLGLLTNRQEPLNGYLEEIGIAPFMEFVLVAGQIGLWKPDPRAFLRAVETAGSHPEETAYVGDNYYADIVGAQRAGLRPVLLDPLGLFPEADVPVIHRIAELPQVVERL